MIKPFILEYQGLQDLINYQIESGNLRILGPGEPVGVGDIILFAPGGDATTKNGRLDSNYNVVPHCGYATTPFPGHREPALEQKMGKGYVAETKLDAFKNPTAFRWVRRP